MRKLQIAIYLLIFIVVGLALSAYVGYRHKKLQEHLEVVKTLPEWTQYIHIYRNNSTEKVYSRTDMVSDKDWSVEWPEVNLSSGEVESGRTLLLCFKFIYSNNQPGQHCVVGDERAWLSFREGAQVKYNGLNEMLAVSPL